MLDPAGAKDVLGIVDDLNRDGMTVISITHKMEEATRAGRILVMHEGRIVADDTPRGVFTHHDLSRWHLSPPPVVELASKVGSRIPMPDSILTVDGLVAALAAIPHRDPSA